MVLRALIAAMWIVLSGAPRAEKYAFVVGIDNYTAFPPDKQLRNARNDAADIAEAFRRIGFKVEPAFDLTRSDFNRRWTEFLGRVKEGDVVAFYFAGHGVEIGGNYLMPSDVPWIQGGREELIRRESLSLNEILTDLRLKKTRFNFVVIDACRENPFEAMGFRSAAGRGGLSEPAQPIGTFIMYSAAAGALAIDNLGPSDTHRNSVFTRSLLPLLTREGLPLVQMAQALREQVRLLAASVGREQFPAYYDQIVGGPACLVGACRGFLDPVPLNAVQAQPTEHGETATAQPARSTQAQACIRVGRKIERAVAVSAGTEFCAVDGSERATILDVTSQSVIYTVHKGRNVTCKTSEICAFNWGDRPVYFSAKVQRGSDGDASKAELLPYP